MRSLCWLLLPLVAGIHPECKIFQQVVKEEALCLERNESVSPDLKGFLQRNCTQEGYWSEPFPSYAVACGFDEGSSKGPEDQVACKAAVAFFQFSILANFFWLLIEGIYLQTLLLLTFVSDKQYVWWFIFAGWGAPTAVMLTWVLTRLHQQNTGCWDDDENGVVLWIIKGPILLTVLINFVIFINVIRILVHKLKSQEGGGSNSSHFVRLAKSTLLLIPLFGVHYIVFAFFPESTGLEARLYIELGLGSFQGFVVALLYCFSNAEVQSELKKQLCKWQYQEYLSFTHKHGTVSKENSPVNYVTQLSLLEKISPKRRTSAYQNGVTSV
ncbi:UNVERIFIED_CONTAM: hypothetical protein H355_002722 [Colinus virginianus]|nr:hypothetical protein H355_002722 [Colinus virginianus]